MKGDLSTSGSVPICPCSTHEADQTPMDLEDNSVTGEPRTAQPDSSDPRVSPKAGSNNAQESIGEKK